MPMLFNAIILLACCSTSILINFLLHHYGFQASGFFTAYIGSVAAGLAVAGWMHGSGNGLTNCPPE